MKNHRLLLALFAFILSSAVFADDVAKRAVLVTGASSGSGRVIAETLAARGYYVYAGARKQADLDELNKIENIHAIRLDVTVQEEIDAAVEVVRKNGKGLYGLVNNAGVATMGPLIEIADSEVEFVFDVNVYGPFRVTKAFAPLIIESQGRITTTGSVSGIVSGAFYGPYSMTKHAMEAFTDSLATEMDKFNVKVSIIEPGGFSSKIGTSTYKRMIAGGFDFDESYYKDEWEENWLLQERGEIVVDNDVPQEIANAVIDTLEADTPKARYMIVDSRERAERIVQKAMQEMLQLNEDHRHTLSRDELVAMLDELSE